MYRLYMKAPEYIQILDRKTTWRVAMFLFHTEEGKYVFVGSIMQSKYSLYDRGVSRFIREFTKVGVERMEDVLTPNTFKLKDVKDRVFLYIVNELTRLAKTEYGKLLLASPGNKGHILRAVVNRNRVLDEMYFCMGLPDFFNPMPWDDFDVTWDDFDSRRFNAYEILDILDKKFHFFDFSTSPEDLETARRIVEILKARKDIERIRHKREKRRKSGEERNKNNDDWMDDYIADDDNNGGDS